MSRIVLAITVAAGLAASELTAQLPTLEPGLRVRLRTLEDPHLVIGMVVSQTPDSITLAVDGVRRVLQAREVARIEVNVGNSRGAGFLVGAVLGTGLGLVVAAPVTAPLGGIVGFAAGIQRWRQLHPRSG